MVFVKSGSREAGEGSLSDREIGRSGHRAIRVSRALFVGFAAANSRAGSESSGFRSPDLPMIRSPGLIGFPPLRRGSGSGFQTKASHARVGGPAGACRLPFVAR